MQIMVRAIDFDSHDEITDTQIEEATFYFFSPEGMLVKESGMPRGAFSRDFGVALENYPYDRVTVYVWGNLGEVDFEHDSNDGHKEHPVYTNFIRLREQSGASDWRLSPGNVFFGTKTFDASSGTTPADNNTRHEVVDITQKNARINVTVRGLPAGSSNDEYYFGFERQKQGYDYAGEVYWDPSVSTNIRGEGIFDDKGNFVTPVPCFLIHDLPQLTRDNCMILALYKAGDTRAGDTKLASTTADGDGNIISLQQAKTTNVLMVLDSVSRELLDVHIEITAWNEIYQWTEI